MTGFDSLDNITVIEKTERSVTLYFSVPDSSPYFDGHFPGFPILPAVAQMELVMRFASRYLGTGISLMEAKRIKFTNIIRPCVLLLLKLAKKENTITFNLSSQEDKIVYSAGTVILGNE